MSAKPTRAEPTRAEPTRAEPADAARAHAAPPPLAPPKLATSRTRVRIASAPSVRVGLAAAIVIVGLHGALTLAWHASFELPWRVALLAVERVGGGVALREPWRWVSASLVHANAAHAIANSALLALVFSRLAASRERAQAARPLAVLGAIAWCAFATNVVLSLARPGAHAVGSSGMVAAALGGLVVCSVRDARERAWALACVALFVGASLAGGVDHAAHALGALFGALLFGRSTLRLGRRWATSAALLYGGSALVAAIRVASCSASTEAWHACFVARYVLE